jgi:acetyl-CoA acetyltransferase
MLALADLDLVEIDGMTLADEALALEAMGMAAPGDGFGLYARSDRINPSGGSAAGWCYPAMGLVRFAECFLRLDAGGKRALAVGSSPIGDQTQTAVVLERA